MMKSSGPGLCTMAKRVDSLARTTRVEMAAKVRLMAIVDPLLSILS